MTFFARHYIPATVEPTDIVTPPRDDLARPPGRDLRPVPSPTRAYAVDALRGLGILGVVLGQTKPYGVLPAWLYHAQEPPPTHAPQPDLAGLTFPDLVFPIFLFTLGVAIPLAMTRRLERGASPASVMAGALKRGGLLFFLAWFRQHFDSVSLGNSNPEPFKWMVSLIGFAVLFLVFTRFPASWSRGVRLVPRAIGWTAALMLFASVPFPEGGSFAPERIDRILVAAAYCVVLGTLIWLMTRRRPIERLGIVAALAVVRAVGYEIAWLNPILDYTPARWLYDFAMLTVLCVAIPGTIVGDLFVGWMKGHTGIRTALPGAWTKERAVGLSVLLLTFVPLLLVGIQGRFVTETIAAASVLSIAALFIARAPGAPSDRLIAQLTRFGIASLLLGLLLDPIEGGTQKVPPTFAWYFQSVGLAVFVLTALFVVTNVVGKMQSVRLLIDNGQNPMVAYVSYGMLLLPILGLSGGKESVDALGLSPWARLAWGLLLLVGVAYIVQVFTRRHVYWRT